MSGPASTARPVDASVPAHPDPVARTPVADSVTDDVDDASYLMAGNDWIAAGEKARQHVAMTDPTGFDLHANFAPARVPLLPFGCLEGTTGRRKLMNSNLGHTSSYGLGRPIQLV
jgi:hypothetical protein